MKMVVVGGGGKGANGYITIHLPGRRYLPSIDQWNTDVSVTRTSVFSVIQRQYVTSSAIVCVFMRLFISMLKIWRFLPAAEKKGRRVNSKYLIKGTRYYMCVYMCNYNEHKRILE